jgi:hypothetical protein
VEDARRRRWEGWRSHQRKSGPRRGVRKANPPVGVVHVTLGVKPHLSACSFGEEDDVVDDGSREPPQKNSCPRPTPAEPSTTSLVASFLPFGSTLYLLIQNLHLWPLGTPTRRAMLRLHPNRDLFLLRAKHAQGTYCSRPMPLRGVASPVRPTCHTRDESSRTGRLHRGHLCRFHMEL